MGGCVDSQSDPSDMAELVSFYKSKQRMVSLNETTKDKSIRVMTYNILADGEGYALSDYYPYTKIEHRVWGYRFPRILAQILAYEPDIVCMQETTPQTYEQSIAKEMSKIGYEGYHVPREVARLTSAMALHTVSLAQSDAIFYKKSRVEVLHMESIRLNKEAEKKEFSKALGPLKSNFRSMLSSKCDVAILLHCRLQQQLEFVALTTHLFWNPRFPDIKAAQAYLLSHAVHRIITDEWKLDIETIPVVLGLDSNSLPFKDTQDIFNPLLPKEGLVSGVYTLWTNGHLPREHLDHPYTRIGYAYEHEVFEAKGKRFDYTSKENLEAVKEIPDWEIPKEMVWQSAYKEASVDSKEPLLTTKTVVFAGCLDYIFINRGFQVNGFLEMPWQKELTYHLPSSRDKDRDMLCQTDWKDEKEAELKAVQTLPPMPNQYDPSDHLPLVVDLCFTSENLKTQEYS